MPSADPPSADAYFWLSFDATLLASDSDPGAASWTAQPPGDVAAGSAAAGAAGSAAASWVLPLTGFSGLAGAGPAGASSAAAGAVVSVFATTTRAEDFGGDSFVGRSIFGVDAWAAPASAVVLAGLAAGFGGAGVGEAGGCAVRAIRSTGCSSLLTTLTLLGCVLSLSRFAPESFEVPTVSSLGGCTLVGPCAAAMNGGVFG